MRNYPASIVPVGHVEPVPRRVRAVLDGRVVLDTLAARYVWEWPNFPQFYIPVADIDPGLLVDEEHEERLHLGTARRQSIQTGDRQLQGVAHRYTESEISQIVDCVRFDWSAFDGWYEEDEEVSGHPRDPYTRIDALRSTRSVRVEIEGVELARTSSPVLVFETGLPTRYYLNRTEVYLERLTPSPTVTACPYKGRTTAYWSLQLGGRQIPDIAWAYDFPTLQLSPIAGLVAFYNEKVDLIVDGELLERPDTR